MKETHYKLKHRVTALFAAAVMLYSMLPGAAFAEEPTPQPTEETVQMEQQAEPSETDNGQTDASSPDLGAATEESAAPTTDEPAEENEPYTFDGEVLYEPKRLARLKPGQISLLDKYHVAEPEARSMCAAEGLLSPLYDFTKRGGCWFCPNASISELRHLYRYHPELWQPLLELQDVPNKPTERFSWRRTFREIDERFRQEGEQLSFYEER